MITLDSGISEYGWKARGDFVAPDARRARPFMPRIIHALKLIPLLIRLALFNLKEWLMGRESFIKLFQLRHDPFTGVPIGGLGCGSIGTDFRGAFNKFSIIPGIKEQKCENIKANQFILSVRDKHGKHIFWRLLTCADFKEPVLKTWDEKFNKRDVHYCGLFPRAWREFSVDYLKLRIVMHQMSPVIPNDYEDSSLPVATFKFDVFNDSAVDYDVSIAFTFRNGTGNPNWNKESLCSYSEFSGETFSGALLRHKVKGMPVTFAVSAQSQVNKPSFESNLAQNLLDITTSHFDPTGDGWDLRKSLENNGHLDSHTEASAKELGVAVCSRSLSKSHSRTNHLFCLVWDMPKVRFASGKRTYRKRYTRFFSGPDYAVDITARAFEKYEDWENAIEKWQKPVLEDKLLPDWFKSALFNELYFVVDGSTVWVEYDDSWLEDEKEMSSQTQEWFKKYGRYAYMESWEYFMYNTYDVHFYASWALLQNWPALEMSIQFDFVDQIVRDDSEQVFSMFTGNVMDRKEYGKTPHDLGHPMGDPWYKINAYQLHDTSHWRDLNLKFVPMCWRDWKMVVKKMEDPTKAMEVLKVFFYRSMQVVEHALVQWDLDGDGMIENSGSADQTYDVWTMTGTSAYCGSLWLCALTCVAAMAEELGKKEDAERYKNILAKATIAYEKKLGNDWYFRFDENPKNDTVVMTDQLCGIWFLGMIGEELPLTDKQIDTALHSLHDLNGKSFEKGKFGPVNGYKHRKEVDTSCIQSEEVWTGIAYALGSFYLQRGMRNLAFGITEGIYESCWRRFGLQWQTPEAITARCTYRAIGYMRPLSIWAMHYAYNNFKDVPSPLSLPMHLAPWNKRENENRE